MFSRLDKDTMITFQLHGKEKYELYAEKRNMRKIIDKMVEVLNLMSKTCPGFNQWYKEVLMDLEKINYDMSTNEITPDEEAAIEKYAISLADQFTSNRQLVPLIRSWIDVQYSIDMDSQSAKSENKNEELQFLDSHAKSILCSTAMIRMVIPIIGTFAYYNSEKKINQDAIFNIVFTRIIELFQVDALIINKLTKLVESRVKTSIYSNKVMWTYLENMGVTPESTITNIRRSLICEIIPKLEYDKSVISMFAAVIKRQLEFLFTENFKIQFKPIAINHNDTKEEPIDFIKIYSKDEGITTLMELDVQDSVNMVLHKINKNPHNDADFVPITISQLDEVFYGSPYFPINEYQKFIVFNIMSSFSGIPYRAFYHMTRQLYARAIILSYHILIRNSMPTLAKLLISVPVVPKRKRLNKQLLGNIHGCGIYNAIIDKNFSTVGERIRNQSVIINKIMSVDTQFKIIPKFTQTMLKEYLNDVQFAEGGIPAGYKVTRGDVIRCSEWIIENSTPRTIPKQMSTEYLMFLNRF